VEQQEGCDAGYRCIRQWKAGEQRNGDQDCEENRSELEQGVGRIDRPPGTEWQRKRHEADKAQLHEREFV